MWTAGQIVGLRTRLGMDIPSFARMTGVEPRTVYRWEADEAHPTGSSEAVLNAVREALARESERADDLVKFIAAAVAVGGLAYLLIKLFESAPTGEGGST